MRPAVADAALKFPGFGHLLGMLGAVGASERSMSTAIEAGDSVCLTPGGIAEMLMSSPSQDAALLSRKGFVRFALRHGVPLVPVYVFGNNHALTLAPLPHFLSQLSRMLRVSLVFVWGRWGLPIPVRVPLLYAIGQPILVHKVLNPTASQVDKLHQVFVDGVVAIYNEHKHTYYTNASDAVLKIL
eukprot:TRINITY_DN4792_c0_g1_i6.p2 TRINITY_DN4792_c0_g1~~TRINITY_DN4792_c0_g1_i6.p2  ORF type:complete len:185 (+),score=29.72 TRINITY_DN4792_c0_g1_i6:700-1254(+)